MSVQLALEKRSQNSCELCGSGVSLDVFEVPFSDGKNAQSCVFLCENCRQQINGEKEVDLNHWRCLNDSMWNTEPAVQVMAWRMLNRLSSETWAQDLLDMLYLEQETLQWAAKDANAGGGDKEQLTTDTHGAQLETGDTVTFIKDLEIKGAGFTAKRGAAIRNITLTDDPTSIEGKLNGTRVVICAKFLKNHNEFEMKLNQADKEQLILKLQSYCSRELDMELGQFDAEFLLDFIGENFGAHFYNQGLYDAQAALNVRIDSVTEAIAELEKPISN